ncbi:MAG: methyltransferase domain-containing protein [Fimbriimonadaceae bacterium]
MDVVLSHFQVKLLMEGRKAGSAQVAISLDLGLSKAIASLGVEGATLPDGQVLNWLDAAKIVKEDRKCFLIREGVPHDIRAFSEQTGWVRSLCPTSGAPTMLVSGFPMHRIKGTDPMQDTLAKMRALGPIKGRVLDTATGLGYTAIEASRSCEVVTVELDPEAVEIARLNPWSQKLFDSKRIQMIVGDAAEYVAGQPAGSFSAVIHDPPTIQFAGELYSLAFYRELKRVLARSGKLFHYVGDPHSAHGAKVTGGVVRRLAEAGFKRIERQPEAFGLTAHA